jgi:hypothetical protein
MSTTTAPKNNAVFPCNATLTRRKFLVASIALVGFATGLPGTPLLRHTSAHSGTSLENGALAALVQMVRHLYPYDAITDDIYAQVLDDVLTATANDETFVDTLRAAERSLNSQQPSDFVDLRADDQIKAMQAVEQTDFFATIHGAVKYRLFNHPAIWSILGYEGPSFQLGGYLHRGAGEIDWLPEDK